MSSQSLLTAYLKYPEMKLIAAEGATEGVL